MSEGEVARRLRYAGYAFERSPTGKHFWVEPGTGTRLPEDRAFALVQKEERRLLTEAGWERVRVEGTLLAQAGQRAPVPAWPRRRRAAGPAGKGAVSFPIIPLDLATPSSIQGQ